MMNPKLQAKIETLAKKYGITEDYLIESLLFFVTFVVDSDPRFDLSDIINAFETDQEKPAPVEAIPVKE